MLAAIYCRYSSDRQREASIEDQSRNCERRAESEGWTITQRYADSAISGSTSDRPGYRGMLADAESGRFQALLVDDLSRLSRDQVEAERTIRRLEHWGIIIVGVSDGYDSRSKSRKVHRGVRNLLNEVYLDDLREKTHRGLEGQARRGNNAGGRCYGYRHVPIEDLNRLDSLGRPVVVAVRREIDPEQAEWVRWIFDRFAAGKSPNWIAGELNRLNVPSPRGGTWASSAIYGSPGKTTGILRNPIYIGRYVWNKSAWIKDPDTGKRIRRERSVDEWIEVDMPELRIVSQTLWDSVQARLNRQTKRSLSVRAALHQRARTGPPMRHLFSGLLKCAACGSPFVTVGNNRYGCSGHKYRGTAVCQNRLSVKRSIVESRLLASVKNDICNSDALEIFTRETRRLLQEYAASAAPNIEHLRNRLAEIEKKIGNLINAIAAGTFSPALQTALEKHESEKIDILREIEEAEASRLERAPDFLPRVSEIYFEMVSELEESLSDDTDRARECLRCLIGDEILIRPAASGKYLEAELKPAYLQQAVGITLNVVAGAGLCIQSTVIPLK
jgi:site-specific DNA recombinase